MPLTPKGTEIQSAMKKEYGPTKGEEVFYAAKNKGTISGVDFQPPVVKKLLNGVGVGPRDANKPVDY